MWIEDSFLSPLRASNCKKAKFNYLNLLRFFNYALQHHTTPSPHLLSPTTPIPIYTVRAYEPEWGLFVPLTVVSSLTLLLPDKPKLEKEKTRSASNQGN